MSRETAARFVVTSRIPEPALELLRAAGKVEVAVAEGALSRADLLALVGGADAAVTLLYDRVDEEFFEAAGPGLRCVANVAVGYDNIDLAAATRRNVAVANTPGVLDDATADLTLGLILAAARRLGESERLVRSGQRWPLSLSFMLGRDLRGKRLGIVGLGAIGQRVASRARAFGMAIAYTGRREADPAVVGELGAERLSLDELLESSDVVSLHAPLTSETRQMIAAPQLARMKSGAILVNAARGQIVDEAALVQALRDGLIAAAALDVYEHEPAVHPGLLELDNVTLIPHLGSATVETRRAMGELAARNAIAAVRGEPLLTPVALPG